MVSLHEINTLLDTLEEDPNCGPFIGRRVSDAIRRAKYPPVWRPLIQRYVELLRENKSTANVSLYCDIACTIITKKIFMVDILYLYKHQPDDGRMEEEYDGMEGLREAHMITATKYLVNMLMCIYECLYRRPANRSDISRAATMLYAELYAEAFVVSTTRETDIFRVVQKWFHSTSVFEKAVSPVVSICNVAPGIPFLACSHVYWLWLHLTAAQVQHACQELLTVIYALDMIVYCEDCKRHFIEFRGEIFQSKFDDRTGLEIGTFSVCPTNAETVYSLHSKVNNKIGAANVDMSVLSDYKRFWEGTVEK